MTSCPFCGDELKMDYTGVMYCCNQNCKKSADWYGSKVLWEEYAKMKERLLLALECMNQCKTRDHIGAVCRTPEYVDTCLAKIAAI